MVQVKRTNEYQYDYVILPETERRAPCEFEHRGQASNRVEMGSKRDLTRPRQGPMINHVLIPPGAAAGPNRTRAPAQDEANKTGRAENGLPGRLMHVR